MGDMIFAGKAASGFGILYKSHHKIIAPYRRALLNVSGRDGAIEMGGNYDIRVERVECCLPEGSYEAFRSRQREIAAWLARSGTLVFTDEPDKRYYGRICEAPDLEQNPVAGEWAMDFELQPFASGANAHITHSGPAPVTIPIEYGGTAPTPCRIIIRNTSATSAANIVITKFMRSAQGGN